MLRSEDIGFFSPTRRSEEKTPKGHERVQIKNPGPKARQVPKSGVVTTHLFVALKALIDEYMYDKPVLKHQ